MRPTPSSTDRSWQLEHWTIKRKILASCALFLVLLASSSLYCYLTNRAVITQQERLREDRQQKVLVLETLATNVALTELESRSYLLLEQEECNRRRRGIWKEKLAPATTQLRALQANFRIASHQVLVQGLLGALSTYQARQGQTEEEARQLLKQCHQLDPAQATARKAALVRAVHGKQRPVFEAITEATTTLSQGQRQLIRAESLALTARLQRQQGILLVLLLASSGLAGLLAYGLVNATVAPLRQLSTYLEALARGQLPDLMPASRDEVGAMIQSINKLVTHLKASARFAVQVGEGKYDNAFSPASPEDTLGTALVTMQGKLAAIAQQDKQRSWASEGLARLNQVLHQPGDLTARCEQALFGLIKYLAANQGGLFLLKEASEPVALQLQACYAFERKKFLTKTIQAGEGLVGQCYQEGETMYLTEIPAAYLKITSGLGETTPRSLLLVPLKGNDTIEGVVELAFFQPLTPRQIQFVEQFAQSLAATIAGLKGNEQTRQLLEQSQQQAQLLRAQEEVMRQNLEELSATQEEMQRKHHQMERLLEEAQEREAVLKAQEQLMQESVRQLQEREETTRAQEGILRQMMEELGAVQTQMQDKEQQYLERIAVLEGYLEKGNPQQG